LGIRSSTITIYNKFGQIWVNLDKMGKFWVKFGFGLGIRLSIRSPTTAMPVNSIQQNVFVKSNSVNQGRHKNILR